jgi:hypothetical protein
MSPFAKVPVRVLAACAAALCLALPARAAVAPARPASAEAWAVHAEYLARRERLENSPFGWPLAIDSRERPHAIEGEAWLVSDHSFAVVSAALAPPSHWCEILLLPFNTKHCEARARGRDGTLTLYIGRKNETPVKDAYRLHFQYAVQAHDAEHLRLVLTSADGPLGTRDYRIVLEATPISGGRTFMKFAYSYAYGTLSRLAMQTYLATIGSSKVGFTFEGRDEGGEPRLVRGMRAAVERNTMRYALAIDAYLDSLALAPGERVRKRLVDWFAATERHPRQLHEIERGDYLAMKEREYARMYARGCCRAQAGAIPGPGTASSSP